MMIKYNVKPLKILMFKKFLFDFLKIKRFIINGNVKSGALFLKRVHIVIIIPKSIALGIVNQLGILII